MKTILIKILIVIISFGSFAGYCQITNSENIMQYSRISVFDSRSKELVGSPYIDKNLLSAKISNDSKIYAMRYNAYLDEMEVEKNGKTYYLPKSYNYTVQFISLNKIYQIFSIIEKGKTITEFFVISFKGSKISLLKKEKIKFYEAVKPQTGYDKHQPPKLKRAKDVLYIGYNNSTTSILPKKKKDLLKLFSSKSKEVEVFAKENRYGFKKEKDLIELFKYYNSLE